MHPSPSPSPPLPFVQSPLFLKWLAGGLLMYIFFLLGALFSCIWCRRSETRALFDRIVERHRVDPEKLDIHECPICLESFREGEECCVLKACKHWYHEGCIKQWLSNWRTLHCPVCRASVREGWLAYVTPAPASS